MAFRREPFPEDVVNRIDRDYAPAERERVAKILAEARDLGFSIPWIQLAALRAASGRIDLLQQWIDLGNKDPRDLSVSLNRIAGADWESDYILYNERS